MTNLCLQEAEAGSGAAGCFGPNSLERPQALSSRLVALVCEAFNVGPAELYSQRRGRAKVARARQTGIYLARVVLTMSFSKAGALFRRDRSTAAHACCVIEKLRDDRDFEAVVSALEAELIAACGRKQQ